MVTTPNFLIIGAPKCGTTSLSTWLAAHPDVHMSPVKEPHFHSTDLRGLNIRDEGDYRALFAHTSAEAVGAAPVWYLYSSVAIPAIEQSMPGMRYIVMLRNPVDMAFSLYGEHVFRGHERATDFSLAWQLSSARRKGSTEHTHGGRDPRLLDYASICLLGQQMERLFGTVERERIEVVFFDDLTADPGSVYAEALRFLGLKHDGRQDFQAVNAAKTARLASLSRLLAKLQHLAPPVKRLLGMPETRSTGVLAKMTKFNVGKAPRARLPESLRSHLTEFFAPDIHLLGRLTQRDLSAWLDLPDSETTDL